MSRENERRVGFAVTQAGSNADGGLESISQVIAGLDNLQPVILTNRRTSFNSRWLALGSEVVVEPGLWDPWRNFAGGPVRRRLARLLSLMLSNFKALFDFHSLKLPIIHFNDINTVLALGVGARLARSKVVFNIRSLPSGTAMRLHWHWACALSHRIVVISDDMAKELEKRLLVKGTVAKVSVIRSGVDLHRLKASTSGTVDHWKRQLLSDPAAVAIGYVGRVCARKQQLDFIEGSLPNLCSNATWHVYFLGDFDPNCDAYSSQCLSAVSRLGLTDKVTFLGSTDSIYDWYQALDIVVLCSEREGLARAMIESVASGTPVVSFDVCSAREILESHECGVVVRQKDYLGLARAVRELIVDPELRFRMGEAGKLAAGELFDPKVTSDRYALIYGSLAGEALD